ncbi:MAG: methyltransferase domain-containing protein [Kofleriaceae bacterium]
MQILVCPGCRTRTPERIDVRTLERSNDLYVCECGRSYPIVDGIPVILEAPVIEPDPDVSPEAAAALVANLADDAPYAHLLEHLSIYLDSHWGAQNPLAAKLAHAEHVALTVELGCSVGRIVHELALSSDHVVGVELSLPAVRRARRLLAGEDVPYAQRQLGHHYTPAIAHGSVTTNTTLICGDALDPPLIPGAYDRVVALNLLDSVRSPRQLLSVIDGLCAPNGEVILSSPYAWQTSIVDAPLPFDPAESLLDILQTGDGLGSRYQILESTDLEWTLRRDARSSVSYRIHWVRARKHSASPTV